MQQCTKKHSNTLQRTVTQCNTLQHSATLYNALQDTATYCKTLQDTTTHTEQRLLAAEDQTSFRLLTELIDAEGRA